MTARNIHSKLCTQCGYDCSGQEMTVPCPRCGSGKFRLEFNGPMTITSRGRATVNLPVYSPNPNQTTIEAEGDVDLTLAGEREGYRFADFGKIKKKCGKNWVQVTRRRDGRGLDVVFGRRPGGEHHPHYSYTVAPKMIYFRSQDDTQLVRTLSFRGNDGVFVPLKDRIDDNATGMSVALQFSLRGSEVVVSGVQFFASHKT